MGPSGARSLKGRASVKKGAQSKEEFQSMMASQEKRKSVSDRRVETKSKLDQWNTVTEK